MYINEIKIAWYCVFELNVVFDAKYCIPLSEKEWLKGWFNEQYFGNNLKEPVFPWYNSVVVIRKLMAWEAGDVLPRTGGIYGRVDAICRVASQHLK